MSFLINSDTSGAYQATLHTIRNYCNTTCEIIRAYIVFVYVLLLILILSLWLLLYHRANLQTTPTSIGYTHVW